MKTKKITKLCALLLILVMLLTACGKKNTDNTTNGGSDVATTESATKPADNFDIEEWGVYDETAALAGCGGGAGFSYSLHYPSLLPKSLTGFVEQKEPILVKTGNGGPFYRAESVEDVLPACIDQLIDYIDSFRPYRYDNFAFNIETTESVTINDFPACKYTGTHTYTDEDGESHTVPFAAYSLDLEKILEQRILDLEEKPEAYIYVIVIDDSVLNPDKEALADGEVEDYAYKMALSVKGR